MEDKRIMKTKRSLKTAMVEMLSKEDFEHISITELCRLAAGYVNMLDSILELYYDRFDFFQHTNPEKNPYLASRLYSIILDTVEMHTLHVKKRLRLKYSPKKIAGFVCFGMLGFVNESHQDKTPLAQIRQEARELMTDLLKSGILTEQEK